MEVEAVRYFLRQCHDTATRARDALDHVDAGVEGADDYFAAQALRFFRYAVRMMMHAQLVAFDWHGLKNTVEACQAEIEGRGPTN